MNIRRASLWVGALATLAYANAIPNGFAYDDTSIVAQNEVVTEGRVLEAWTRPYWPRHSENSGLYRPVTISSFAAEWRVFGTNPVGYHAVNVVAHAGASLLILWLVAGWASVAAAAVGATVFAVHPLHVEAVANIVGRSELFAAGMVLGALLLYDRGRSWSGLARAGRLLGVGLLYFLGLGSKEIAVTLPGLMVLTDLFPSRRPDQAKDDAQENPASVRESIRSGGKRLLADLPVYGICIAALVAYLLARTSVVGALLGDLPAPSLRDLGAVERVATAFALWPEYLRLLLFPLALSADYSPAVLFPATQLLSGAALLGMVVLGLLVVATALAWQRNPLVAMGILWFFVAVLPVSHFFFPTGVLLAERTLYLPSVALAFLATGGWSWVQRRSRAASDSPRASVLARRATVALIAVTVLLLVRTVTRNPTWMSTFTTLQTLAREHPESSLAVRTRATGLARAGDFTRAADLYETAVELAPRNYSILTEVGNFYGERGAWADGERLLRHAASVSPDRAAAYRLLAGQLIQQARFQEAHRVALDGLKAAGADRELFGLVSETYVAKGDFSAAVRAREAAVEQDPSSVFDLTRLAEVYGMAGMVELEREMTRRAREALERDRGRVEFTPTGRIVHRPRTAVARATR